MGGVETIDASSGKKFSLRGALLWTLNDFPALAYLYGWSTGGTYACPSCGASTKSFYLNKSKKDMLYGSSSMVATKSHISKAKGAV